MVDIDPRRAGKIRAFRKQLSIGVMGTLFRVTNPWVS